MKKESGTFFVIGWKAAGLFSWFMWIVGSFLSYWGFTHLTNVPLWVKITAGGFAIGINIVEFVLNRMTLDELMDMSNVGDVILRLFGIVCYAYDIWTNILGFIVVFGYTSFMEAWNVDITMAIFAMLFGLGFAIGPEPLYIRYLKEMEELKGTKKPIFQSTSSPSPAQSSIPHPTTSRVSEILKASPPKDQSQQIRRYGYEMVHTKLDDYNDAVG